MASSEATWKKFFTVTLDEIIHGSIKDAAEKKIHCKPEKVT
jgi:hypothetical protein